MAIIRWLARVQPINESNQTISDFDGDVPSDPSLISDPNADAAAAAALACRFPGAKLLHADPVVWWLWVGA